MSETNQQEDAQPEAATLPGTSVGNGSDLRAVVDMGSNGIRFSISDLSTPTARIMPTLFQDRASISLYDAQYGSGEKEPIREDVIEDVLRAFEQFKRTCGDFNVPETNIRVVATEATREATNSAEFREKIKRRVGWDVEMLSKQQEGEIGAMGIASSFEEVNGLVMDLGGGSVQLSMITTNDGDVQISQSISLPYGAAALSRRLEEAKSNVDVETIENEVGEKIFSALQSVSPLDASGGPAYPSDGLQVFLSGGGFRGWGHVMMDQPQLKPYPIPTINGFQVDAAQFKDTKTLQFYVYNRSKGKEDIYRVSKRRAGQIPAVALIVKALTSAGPKISTIRFCQGGVREGVLFASLPMHIRAQRPLIVATRPYAPTSSVHLQRILSNAVPLSRPRSVADLLEPFINVLFVYRDLPKGAKAAAGLRLTTAGILAGIHGLDHMQRAMLALMLCERWDDGLSPTDEQYYNSMQKLVGTDLAWWTKYVGRLGQLIGAVYPAGLVPMRRMSLAAVDNRADTKIKLEVFWRTEDDKRVFAGLVKGVKKIGRAKRWEQGNETWGKYVEVEEAISALR